MEKVAAGRRDTGAARAVWTRGSTPQRLVATLVSLVVGLTLASVAVAGSVRAADTRVADVAGRLGPVSTGSLALYRSLADADAALVGEVLAQPVGGGAPSRAAYDEAVAVAGRSVAATGSQAGGDAFIGDRLGDVASALPNYAGLAERARLVGGADSPDALQRATDLMRATVLPTAELVQSRQAQQLDSAYTEAAEPPVLGIVLGSVVVVGLLAAQIYLWRRTRRVCTLGMVLATLASVGGGLWWAVAGTIGAQHLDASRAHLQMVTEALGPAQVVAAQARSAEGLALVNRDDESDADFQDLILVLARDGGAGGALGAARALAPDDVAAGNVTAAVDALNGYALAHGRVRTFADTGRLGDAVRSVAATSPGSSASAYGTLDRALTVAVDRETDAFRTEVAAAQAWRRGLLAVVLVLGAVAVGGVCWGLGHRLAEYR